MPGNQGSTGECQFDTDLFRIDNVLQMRQDKRTYFDFLELFAPAIVGKNRSTFTLATPPQTTPHICQCEVVIVGAL